MTYRYLHDVNELNRLVKNRRGLPEGAYRFSGNDINAIIILGEAARSDHFHLNGYAKNTSPNLEKWNAISYPNVLSYDTVTRISVPYIFTRSSGAEFRLSQMEYSFISVFRKLGFLTVWLSNQAYLGRHDTPVSAIAKESEIVNYVNKSGDIHGGLTILDENLLPYFNKYLEHPAGNKLIVVHLLGSHWNYEYHYSEKYRFFTPVCRSANPESCEKEYLINSYDNTMLYADGIIGEVITSVKDMNSIVFFISDHGESLGENEVYLHSAGQTAIEQRMAAMFVWASEKYKKNSPGKYRNLVHNRSIKTDHRIIFHTILDGAGIESKLIDRNLSIFSDTCLGQKQN